MPTFAPYPLATSPALLLRPRPSCCLDQKALSWGASLGVALLSSRLLFRCSVLEEVSPAARHPSLPAVIGRTHWCLLSPPPTRRGGLLQPLVLPAPPPPRGSSPLSFTKAGLWSPLFPSAPRAALREHLARNSCSINIS